MSDMHRPIDMNDAGVVEGSRMKHVVCPECRAKSWAYGIKYRQEHPEYVEKKRESDRKRREFRIFNHLCVNCGEKLTNFEYKNCEKCRNYNKLRMRKRRTNGI